MSDTVIKIENLWKEYRYGVVSHHYLFKDLQSWWARVLGKEDPNSRLRVDVNHLTPNVKFSTSDVKPSNDDHFWALKDINLEIKQGEIVGIIGRNGAGKSTLLKILSRVTAPTKGSIKIKGRIGSLLEVGTGFHPELTGRENIFLNGAILGMRKKEIQKKFDEIVAFAEVEKFIDTPVKRYSSGMYVRLAFAVAAHLDMEILVVDEVLAVGDAQFQKKCLGKMGDVSKNEGRTVLFVSHNMQAVRQLCRRGVVLQEGTVIKDNSAEQITDYYLRELISSTNIDCIKQIIQDLPFDPVFKLENIELTQDGLPVKTVLNGKPLQIAITYLVRKKVTGLRVFFELKDREGLLLFQSFHDEQNNGIPETLPGEYISQATIPANLLGPIEYIITIQVGIHNCRMCIPYDLINIPIEVKNTGEYNKAYVASSFHGKMAPMINWVTILKL